MNHARAIANEIVYLRYQLNGSNKVYIRIKDGIHNVKIDLSEKFLFPFGDADYAYKRTKEFQQVLAAAIYHYYYHRSNGLLSFLYEFVSIDNTTGRTNLKLKSFKDNVPDFLMWIPPAYYSKNRDKLLQVFFRLFILLFIHSNEEMAIRIKEETEKTLESIKERPKSFVVVGAMIG